jgi:hypothetical protein
VLTKDNIVGLKHQFEDGDSLEVMQVKSRNEEMHLVTYHVQQGPGIPRKLIMELNEFIGTYGYLFEAEKD